MLCFSLFHCRFQLHFSFFALLAFCCVVTGIEGGAILLLSAFLHEAAHLGMMLALHVPPEAIDVSALGCRITLSRVKRPNYAENGWISLAGPCANLLLALFLALWGKAGGRAVSVNLLMGCLHLMPVEPLDGGLALHAFLCRHMNPEKAFKISFLISLLFLFPLSVAGFLVLLRTRYNFSLLALGVYIMFYLIFRRDFLL